MSPRLFHFSERGDIARFEPRPAPTPAPGLEGAIVWAVDQAHEQNYLLPRDCPRVTFFARLDSDPADVARLLGQTSARFVVAIESSWLQEIRRQRLYRYELPPAPFALHDAAAGYYIAREPVTPLGVTIIDDLLAALLTHDVELRVMPSLWKLRDAVVASSLEFSIIRMRNAQSRPEASP